MNLVRCVAKFERIGRKKSRRFLVRYENPETGLLEPPGVDEGHYTKIFVGRIVRPDKAPEARQIFRPGWSTSARRIQK